jgi:hypothetical protein
VGYEAKAAHLRAVSEQHREEFGNKPLLGGTDLKGLSAQEVAERMLRQKQLTAQRAASQIVYPELYDERHDEFMDKWNLPKATSAIPKTDKDPSAAMPLPPAKPGSSTWKGR